MKNQQQQEARELYFNTNLSKTEIAERLSVSRRTIYQWSVDGDWQKLRESARHMPAILAEKCSFIIGHFMDHLLNAESSDMAITRHEVNMLHKLTITLQKLKKGSTVAENMETFNYLLERIDHKDPALAQQVAPHVEEYIKDRRGKDESAFLLHGFDETGHLPYSEIEHQEFLLDQQEAAAILAEQQTKQQTKQQTSAATAPAATKPNQTQVLAQNTAPSSQSNAHHQFTKPRPVHTPLYADKKASPQKHNTAVAA